MTNHRALSLLATLGLTLASCADKNDPMLITTVAEPAGENCELGGVAVVVGVDRNDDGALSADEIDSIDYACNGGAGTAGQSGTNGADGASYISTLTEEAPGDNCAFGGFLVETGPDADSDGALDEVVSSTYVCLPAPPADALVVIDTAYVGAANSDCPGGFIQVEFGYDLDGSGSVEGAEVAASVLTCNALPQIDVTDLTLIDDCTSDVTIPSTITDLDGTIASLEVTVLASGSEITPSIAPDGTITLPAGSHRSGALLAITATDNYGATNTAQTLVGFNGTGCLLTDTFYGVNPDYCESIDVDGAVGDDRGGPVVSTSYIYYNGDNGLVRTNLDLTGATVISEDYIDVLLADATEGGLYTLWSSAFTVTNLADVTDELESCNSTTFDQIAQIDETTNEITVLATLEAPVSSSCTSFPNDIGAGSTDFYVNQLMLGMRDGAFVVALDGYDSTTGVYAVDVRLYDTATGTLSGRNVILDSDANYGAARWRGQEVLAQHYLLLQRGGEFFITYESDASSDYEEMNLLTGEIVLASDTFGANADLHNLALDPSGLYAITHAEGGFFGNESESLDRCLILFDANDGSVDDRG